MNFTIIHKIASALLGMLFLGIVSCGRDDNTSKGSASPRSTGKDGGDELKPDGYGR
jgi:hypothetical protein